MEIPWTWTEKLVSKRFFSQIITNGRSRCLDTSWIQVWVMTIFAMSVYFYFRFSMLQIENLSHTLGKNIEISFFMTLKTKYDAKSKEKIGDNTIAM